MKKFLALILSVFLGLGCFAVGYQLSLRRPLWNDELYTQTNTLKDYSSFDLWKGKSPEGNNAPLYYWIQKMIGQIQGVQLNKPWQGEWFVHDEQVQIHWRFFSNVCLSAAMALMFYLLATEFSLGTGIMAVIIFLSIPSAWLYWIEARPYALWILLTVIQSMFIVQILHCLANNRQVSSKGLLISHILLSLTIAFGAVQSAVACVIVTIYNWAHWRKWIGALILPIAISAYYFSQSPQFAYWFRGNPWDLISANVPLEWGTILVLGLGSVAYAHFKRLPLVDVRVFGYSAFTCGMLICAMAILSVLQWKAGDGSKGFALTSRYFLFLLPVVSMALAIVIYTMRRLTRNYPWVRFNISLFIGGLIILRAAKTYIALLNSGTFVHLIR